MAGQTVELNIFQKSIDGFGQFVKEYYPKKDIPVVLQPGRFYMRALGRQNKVIKFPFISISINSISEIKDGYNNTALRIQGFTANKNKSQDLTYRYKLKNVNANMQIGFYTNDYSDLLKFSEQWMTGDGILQFNLVQDEQTEIGITCLRSKDIAFPQEQIEEIGEFFALETTCDMRTYMGFATKIPAIKSYAIEIKTVESIHINAEQ